MVKVSIENSINIKNAAISNRTLKRSIISNLLPTILLTFEPSGCSSVKVPVGWAL